jgi:lactoylglutathione lyase
VRSIPRGNATTQILIAKESIVERRKVKFGYTIIYVPDVAASLAFFENAFGLSRRFLHESGDYGELDTGETTLAFASLGMGESHFKDGFVPAHSSTKPLGVEIALVTDDVSTAHLEAIAAGAIEINPPEAKPWGQTVSYLHCPDGTLVELCTPMSTVS